MTNPTSKVLTRLGRCHFALGDPDNSLDALRRALALEPGNDMAQIFRSKALKQQTDIQEFAAARARNHWRMAQTACESCVASVEKEEGEVPAEWRCWGIEVEIARGRWDSAVALAEYVLWNYHLFVPYRERKDSHHAFACVDTL